MQFTAVPGRFYFTLSLSHLPGLVSRPVVRELLLDPDVDLVEGHLLLRGGHGQADQRCVGVGRFGRSIAREVHVLERKTVNWVIF